MSDFPRGVAHGAAALRRVVSIVGAKLTGVVTALGVMFVLPDHLRQQLRTFVGDLLSTPDLGSMGLATAVSAAGCALGAVLFGPLAVHETVWDRFLIRFQRQFDAIYALPRLMSVAAGATYEQYRTLVNAIRSEPHRFGVIASVFESLIESEASQYPDPSYGLYWNAWLRFWICTIFMLLLSVSLVAACATWAFVDGTTYSVSVVAKALLGMVALLGLTQLTLDRAKRDVKQAFENALRSLESRDNRKLIEAVRAQLIKLPVSIPTKLTATRTAPVTDVSLKGPLSLAPGPTVFLAATMSAAASRGRTDTFPSEKRRAELVHHRLTAAGYNVYAPIVQRESRANFLDPAVALTENLKALSVSKVVVALHGQNVASSMLLETGAFLAWGRPIVYLHTPEIQVPYLLRRVGQVFPFSRLRSCRSDLEFAEAAVEEVRRVLGGPDDSGPEEEKAA